MRRRLLAAAALAALWALPASAQTAAPCVGTDALRNGADGRCRRIMSDIAALKRPQRPEPGDPGKPGGIAEKQRRVFYEKIVPSAYAALPDLSKGLFLGFEKSGAPQTADAALEAAGDEKPPERRRPKAMNTFGTAALFEFVAEPGSPYTGIFRGGAGVMRFSYAGPPGLVGNVPGVALKFFTEGGGSRDLVAMNGFAGQGDSTSVFLKPMSTALPEPESPVMKAVAALLGKLSKRGDPLRMDLAHLADVDSSGKAVAAPAAPDKIFLEPTHQDGIPADTRADFRSDLARVKPGIAVYRVTALSGGRTVVLGRIVTRSAFVASEYGDTALAFKH